MKWKTSMPDKKNNKITGQKGEAIACEYLKKSGYKILATNFRYSRLSEIDIVAKEKDTIVFVEVKTRSTTAFGHPYEAINKQKLSHIFQAGLYYLKTSGEKFKNYRIDIISVLEPDNPRIEHLKNISLN